MIVPILSALGLIGPEVAGVLSALLAAKMIIKGWHMLRAAMA